VSDLPSPEPKPPSRHKSRFLILFVAFALGVPAGFVVAHAIQVPLVKSLEDYQPAIITRVYDRNGTPFAEYAIQKRIVVTKKDMAPALVEAIIATEDADFYNHGGFNPKSIVRAGLRDLIARKKVEGASTLTQQLAKQVFLTPEKSWTRKVNEMFLAVDIEKKFTKDQIFELYANQMYLGHGAYGVEAASRLYFGKHAQDLTLPEAAMIAGLFRHRGGYYSPIIHPDHAIARRNVVLHRMLEEHYINEQQYQQAMKTPLVLGTYKEETPKVGGYFSEEIRQYIERNEKFGAENLYQRGLKVYTTLDLPLQEAIETTLQRGLRRWDRRRGFRRPSRNLNAEGADPETYKDPSWSNDPYVQDHLYTAVVTNVDRNGVRARINNDKVTLAPAIWTGFPSMEGHLKRGDLISIRLDEDSKTHQLVWKLDQMPQVQGAAVILDVKTGEVRAMVGGYDFQISKFNRAIQSRRQTGSSFKPIVYGAAFEKGLTPADTIFDEPIAIPLDKNTIYAPKNYYGRYSGIVTIQRALELSINVPAVKTWMMVGGKRVADFAHRLGITSDIPLYPSSALGAAGVAPMEMTAAYNVFANQGVFVKPRLIRKIVDQTDRVLEEQPPELSEATDPRIAYEVAYMLRGTVVRGTAYEAHTLPPPVAGKTGTTNAYTDAWFIGFSPEFCVGVWVGYDDPSRTLGPGATGAEVALPIWIEMFKQIDALKLRTTTRPDFEPPPGVVIVPMDLKTGRRGVGPCARVVMEAFIAGQEPDKDCNGSTVAVSKLPYYLQRPFYQPKELEPTLAAPDASAQTGEGAESPAPPEDEVPVVPTTTTTTTTTAPPRPATSTHQ
jgi:penicillin-binding protein 1A